MNHWEYLVQEDRVHRSVYTDPQIFEEEMIKIYGQNTWVYLLHESEIPKNNDYKTGYLGKRPIIILRDQNGNVRALFNRCMHRGATLCRMEKGNSKQFACPYHGWNFKNDGTFIGAPWPKAYGDQLNSPEFNLMQVRVEIYKGFIFGTLNQEGPSLDEYLGNAKELLDQWLEHNGGADKIRVNSNAHRKLMSCNWKFVYDNAADGYHVTFSHRSLLGINERYKDSGIEEKDMVYFTQKPDDSPMYVQYLGNGHIFLDQRPAHRGANGKYWKQQRPQPGREAFEGKLIEKYGEKAYRYLDQAVGSQMNLTIFPNLLLVGNQIQVIEPIAVDKTQITWNATTIDGYPDEINNLRMRTQEDFPAFGEPDDLTNWSEGQRGLSIPEAEWVFFNRGLTLTETHHIGENGVITAPVTDELPMRGYFNEWKKIMSLKKTPTNYQTIK
jgi:phenylpropionate dioxygenase-like ring-hydroxylating dioxygenase large terminal subunit